MNLFVEGLQGSGKSTLVQKLEKLHPGYTIYREGDYSPIELAWCAYLTEEEYARVLSQYPALRPQIAENTIAEGDRRVVCYTKVRTDDRAFFQDLERFEIYNGRVSCEDFEAVRLRRYREWHGNGTVSECALMQNTVEDMILFRQKTDEEILMFFRRVRETLAGKPYRILYLSTEDIEGNLGIIRKERSDEKGNELWFPMLLDFFNESPWAAARGLSGEQALLAHLAHRQTLEMRICREIFPDRSTILRSKDYRTEELPADAE